MRLACLEPRKLIAQERGLEQWSMGLSAGPACQEVGFGTYRDGWDVHPFHSLRIVRRRLCRQEFVEPEDLSVEGAPARFESTLKSVRAPR